MMATTTPVGTAHKDCPQGAAHRVSQQGSLSVVSVPLRLTDDDGDDDYDAHRDCPQGLPTGDSPWSFNMVFGNETYIFLLFFIILYGLWQRNLHFVMFSCFYIVFHNETYICLRFLRFCLTVLGWIRR